MMGPESKPGMETFLDGIKGSVVSHGGPEPALPFGCAALIVCKGSF